MTDLFLFTNPMSRGAITCWMLEELGEPWTAVVVEYGEEMASDAYRSINPMGKVPALRHGERIVTEAAAICAYLAETFPDAGLAPAPDERAPYFRWLFFAAGPLDAAVTARALNVPAADPKTQGMLSYGSYERTMDTLDAALANTPYIAGNRFTAADVYVGSTVCWGLRFGTMQERPHFRAYAERVSSREAFARAEKMDVANVVPFAEYLAAQSAGAKEAL